MDSARAMNLSCYGYQRETTPCIDNIAENSSVYENAIATAPWTLPSHASLFTGTYSRKHNAHSKHKYLDDKYITLQEGLRKNGYQTVGISSNTWMTDSFGFARGFSDFRHVWQLFHDAKNAEAGADWRSVEGTRGKLSNMWKAQDGNAFGKGTGLLKSGLNRLYSQYLFTTHDSGARRINRTAKNWISKQMNSGQPFYMFINYMESHAPFDAPEPYRSMYLPGGVDRRKVDQVVKMGHWEYIMGGYELDGSEYEILESLYNGELTYTDYRVHELYSFLADKGILDNTILIITSDHGDELGEHNLLYHSLCLYDTVLRVPLIIRYPEIFGKQMVKGQVQLLDIFPTILDALDLDENTENMDGQSFLEGTKREIAIAEYYGFHHTRERIKELFPDLNHDALEKYDRELKVIRTDEDKFIQVSNGRNELYNLNSDPGEQNNIIDQEEKLAEELQSRLKAWEDSCQSEEVDAEIAIDERVKKRLRDMGYIE